MSLWEEIVVTNLEEEEEGDEGEEKEEVEEKEEEKREEDDDDDDEKEEEEEERRREDIHHETRTGLDTWRVYTLVTRWNVSKNILKRGQGEGEEEEEGRNEKNKRGRRGFGFNLASGTSKIRDVAAYIRSSPTWLPFILSHGEIKRGLLLDSRNYRFNIKICTRSGNVVWN